MLEVLSGGVQIIRALSGFRTKGPTAYLKAGRLEDVLALIQVLALHPSLSMRTETGLERALQGPPKSSGGWIELAKEHQEFFRVSANSQYPVSLVSRFIADNNNNEERKPLPIDSVQSYLSTAIEIHDRQFKRAERWTSLIPIWAALVSGFILLGATVLKDSSNTDANKVYKVQIVKESITHDISPQSVSPSTAKDK